MSLMRTPNPRRLVSWAAAAVAFVGSTASHGESVNPWQERAQLAASPENMPDRLRMAVADFPPFAMPTPDGTWTGTAVDLFAATARDIGVEVEFIEMSLAEILPGLTNEMIDGTVLPLTGSATERAVMTLTPEWMQTSLRIAVQRRDFRDDVRLLTTSLVGDRQLRVYALVAILLFCFAALVYTFERKRNSHFRGRHHEGIGSGLWWSITTLSTVGYGDKVPQTPLGRTIAGAWMLVSLVLVALFTATVTSAITASDAAVEVTGKHDLPVARVGMLQDGLAEDYFSDHFIPHVSYPRLGLALRELALGNLDAVVADVHGLEQSRLESQHRDLMLLDEPIDSRGISFGFRKNLPSAFVSQFDAALTARIARTSPIHAPSIKDPTR